MLNTYFCPFCPKAAGSPSSPSTASARARSTSTSERVASRNSWGSPASASSKIRLDDMQSCIGRSQADKVELDAAAICRWRALGSQRMKIRLSLRARPDYVAEQGAIYLRDLRGCSRSRQSRPTGGRPHPAAALTFNQSHSSSPRPRSIGSMAAARASADCWTRSRALKEPGRLVIPFS